MSAKKGLPLWIAIAAVTLALATGSTAQQPAKGEQILSASCTTCHDLRPIQTQALDAEGWTKTVGSMIEKGAKVNEADVPILVQYLVRNHGPLPEGAGKKIVLNICTLCHDLNRIREHIATVEEWEETLIAMLNEGAPLSEADFPVVLSYLARNFNPER